MTTFRSTLDWQLLAASTRDSRRTPAETCGG